jgi:hypothetical protein
MAKLGWVVDAIRRLPSRLLFTLNAFSSDSHQQEWYANLRWEPMAG